ncbi:MAG: glycoside hydrolase family 18 protein [Arcticibacter sp.]
MKNHIKICCCLLACFFYSSAIGQQREFRVIGYYAGRTIPPDSFQVEHLTHLIWCFGHLKGNRLNISTEKDSTIIQQMVALKKRNPKLKVMLSLGGWGGCETCSDVFSTQQGRNEFAQSARELSDYFATDGIDLDWEYPVVPGPPGHKYQLQDRENFTELVRALRKTLKPEAVISFASGGFTAYIDSSIDWKQVMPMVDFVNVMSYDLVHGYSTISGHHTPLYSTKQQTESTDNAVNRMLAKGVEPNKIVIGAAFYGRFFEMTEQGETGLYRPCKFKYGFSSKYAKDSLITSKGFEFFWDDEAQAPYAINRERKLLATYDDAHSVKLKTEYAWRRQLGGIMFWQLYDDAFKGGLLEIISNTTLEIKEGWK